MNACIAYISSRGRCIGPSIKSLWDNFNHKYDYPVYVFYFDDIYQSEEKQREIVGDTGQNVIFREIPYKTPEFLKEEELFYNRNDLWYSRAEFSISRKGYLHMCNFTSNMYGYENTELHKYDYIMTHDDESGYTREMPYNPFEIMDKKEESMGAYISGKRLKNGQPHQGHLDTRIGLWDFTKEFLDKNNIEPKSEELKNLLLLPDSDSQLKFHFLDWCDTYVIKSEMFKSDLWGMWIKAVNDSGGIYKYRWGDNEIISLFAHIYSGKIHNLKTVEEGIHDQGMFRRLQDIAPNIKNINL